MRSNNIELHRNQRLFRIGKKSTMLKPVYARGETHAGSTAASSWFCLSERWRAATRL
jgi:hypothetical protein